MKTHSEQTFLSGGKNPFLPLSIYIPDGEPKFFDGRVYLYGSKDYFGGEYCCHKYHVYSAPADNLEEWTDHGPVLASTNEYLEEGIADGVDWSDGLLWAPDIVKVGDEYRLYCSNSSWGVRQSCIFLAVSDKAEGPFEPKGIVLKTTDDMPVNAIDANIIEDVKTGEQYMVYGSFWGGCHILKLDKETGYAAEEGIGTCVARRPMWTDRAIEGPYIIYNPDTEYYYLFVSYGSLNSDYNIRVGRSKSVTGPYLDFNGRDLTDLDDEMNEIGLMIAGGYHYQDGQDYMAPGHNSVLRDDDGKWYVVCHIREHNMQKPQPATMHIYQMFWSEEGWPFLCPQRYAGESAQPIPREMICGHYERIKLAHTIPQGVQNSVYMKLYEDGRAEICSLFGTWEMKDDQTIILRQGNTVETLKFITVWDYQRRKPALAFTGMDQKGICVWGKRIDKIEI